MLNALAAAKVRQMTMQNQVSDWVVKMVNEITTATNNPHNQSEQYPTNNLTINNIKRAPSQTH
ncbi:MAG: hypothetical protein K9G61_10965 [Bacteroidales bacterium]|nr:hypothetical protein [Bacteroidales bacterium]